MNVALRRPWTQQEFFDWAEAQEGRYEFDGFEPVAMTGGQANHSVIHRNILFALISRLRGACQALGPDAGLATLGERVRYPDVLVTCSAFGGTARTIPGVIVVFEVVSPTSGRIDRIVKVREYAAVPSIRRYVILESTEYGATVMTRDAADAPWIATTLTEADTLDMPEIGVDVPVAEFYDRVAFDPPGAR